MSEPKLISPLLDGFSIGAALKEHDGVHCCPALKGESEEKYIVKIISIPASQVQLDALLLTGAYREPSAALDYFKELADGVEKEAVCLKNLARLEGFLAFEGWQVIPMENGDVGYEVYLLSPFRQALEKHVRRNNMTHLGAINLGIDICNALSAARRAGWIYVDLKPSNIFISENKEYRIGDLGLMELDGLELAALPAKYRSAYTAPELQDEMLSPNTTQDTYALGMILYQIYNAGQLPQVAHPTEDILPPPAYADYELAEIILKACAPDPADRWEDPADMGRSLVAYMQRNTVNDIPIIPPVVQMDTAAEVAVPEEPAEIESVSDESDTSTEDQEALSPEMEDLISQADELIAHDLPDPPVAPEGPTMEQLEEQMRKSAEAKKQSEADLQAMLQQLETQEQEQQENTMPPMDIPVEIPSDSSRKTIEKKDDTKTPGKNGRKGWLVPIVLGLILGLCIAGGCWFYQNYYVQMIHSLSVDGAEDKMTVRLDTDIDENLLTVVCTDTYGNTSHRPVKNGTAQFTNLLPDMLYQIHVEIEGFHRLDGSTTHEYATPAETRIVNATAVTGPEDGSMILTFAVEGPDSEEWTAICSTEGEAPVATTFTGHMVTISGLSIGRTYGIILVPTADLYIPSGDTLSFTASAIIIPQDLIITPDGQGSITVTWNAPEGAQVDSWNVHCYNNQGYDQKLTTDQLSATFDDIRSDCAYTIEVTAAGMTQPARVSITANPLYITDIRVDASDRMKLTVSWDFTGNAPENGWLLLYTIDGSDQPHIVQCQSNSGVIEVRVPNAAYDLTIQTADGTTVFGNTHSHRTAEAAVYENPGQAFYRKVQADYFFVNLLKTPAKANWTHQDVYKSMHTTTFAAGDSISILMYFMRDFYIYHEDITVMYVIRDESGTVLADHIAIENLDWRDGLWNGPNYHYCGLDVPSVPAEPGSYTLDVYFDGLVIASVQFTITE